MSVNHPDYQVEKQHLEETKAFIDRYLKTIQNKQETSSEHVKEAYENLDFLDSSQSYITILVNARYLDRSQETADKISRAKQNPYFSRIDFRDHRDSLPQSFYIGKISLFKEDNEPVVIDWRSPLASLYYDGRIGEVSYEAAEGEITGELSLKRQYTIEDGELNDFFDVDITTNDELLQASLRGNADDKLKDIVSTIQAEQNRVIRADLTKPLIVQGAAGSGKTTVALHRIAYLIYTYEKSFNPDNFMIIAPNSLFLDYISEVLPDLGVEEAKQTTFNDFCVNLLEIAEKYKVTDNKLATLLNDQESDTNTKNLINWASWFKGSLEFKQLLDNYLEHTQQVLLPDQGIYIEEYPIMDKEELERAFTEEYDYLPLHKRLDQIKKKLSTRAKQQKSLIISSIEKEYEQRIEHARNDTNFSEEYEQRRERAVALMEERDEKIDRIKAGAKKIVSTFTNQFTKQRTLKHYQQLLKSPDQIMYYEPWISQEQAAYLSEQAKQSFKTKALEMEDLAPLVYLKLHIEGFSQEITSSNVVIDEAQDFSLFQLLTLKQVLGTDNFTLLGDLSQGIHSYRSIQNWEVVNSEIFNQQAEISPLYQSYRTTVEIMEEANNILAQGLGEKAFFAKPVVRHGNPPQFSHYQNLDQLQTDLAQEITKLEAHNYNSIAVISKTLSDCQNIQKLLNKQGIEDIQILQGTEENYKAGTLIVPAYAAKGLEFDAAIITAIEESFTVNELDAKLLYVAMTRAMHHLSLLAMKGKVAYNSLSEQIHCKASS